ncbi:flagellar basal-body rod protein FlgG [Acidovorax delafieldii 2AN]|uniref:Flagellar basal-body rod protein FlgG n=1 Tax=Acidovorax delafieldii 2AN TaxID=573060 RepID=C5TAM9_ACIDE|nr:flagellar basal-body rod protein FlgG [Acidovorax delafieldii]EER58474.1 flagellar basal-body rod protein FlgG [Acidovorax delafieldii 2AN]
MINSLWIAKTGMSAQQTQLDVISHNLANVSTTGYKRNNAVFEDLIYQNLRQVGANSSEQSQLPTGLHLGLGVNVVATNRDFRQGALQQSGKDFDLAINGAGFFQVSMPDGTTAYTRDGSFTIDKDGQMVNSSGYPLTDGITKVAGAVKASIAANGEVTFTDSAGKAVGTGRLTLASFINPAGLEPVGQNLYKESIASGNPQTGSPTSAGFGELKQGFLETSNVNVVEELVTMIQTQRAYEMNSKAIQTSDQMLAKLAQL